VDTFVRRARPVGPAGDEPAGYSVVWWDPHVLELGVEVSLGIKKPDLIVKDVPGAIVTFGLRTYESWRQRRDSAATAATLPSIAAQTATAWAKSQAESAPPGPAVSLIELPRDAARPGGIRFGALVHAVLATVPLHADADTIRRLVAVHGRSLGASDEEVSFASMVVSNVLAHPVLGRARAAQQNTVCRREVPLTLRTTDGALIEGVVDLAFIEDGRWQVVDFKTDEELRASANYNVQVSLYASALEAATGKPAAGVLMRI
jgi:ATP-dependent exoDNAse (exonuclease V) beta subunit